MDGTWLRRNLRFLPRDLAMAAAFMAVFLLTAHKWADTPVSSHRTVDTTGYVLLGTIAAGMLIRRWAPLPLLAAQSLLVGTFVACGYPHGPYFIAIAVTGITVGRTTDRRRAAVAAAGTTVLIATGELTSYYSGYVDGGWNLTVGLAASVLAGSLPIVAGALIGEHRAWRAKAEEETTRRLVDDERLRMAREVHDVVGHSLSIISLQAGVALHVLDRRPEQAQISLEAIRRTAIEALDELRATLALTRAARPRTGQPDEECPSTGTAPAQRAPATQRAAVSATPQAAAPGVGRTPLTGLGRLPGLLAEIRLCGIPVDAVTSGPLDTLPADVDLAAYRIVQESLTNVLRHAAASLVTIEVTVGDGTLSIDVADCADPPAARRAVPPGHGLTGLRERAEELGGRLTAGPSPGGGWRVRAQLPVPRPQSVAGAGGGHPTGTGGGRR